MMNSASSIVRMGFGICLAAWTVVPAWEVVPSTTATDLFSLQFTSADTGFAIGTSTLLKTTDRGAHWTSQSLTRPLTQAFFSNGNLGWAISDSVTILRTTNSGQQWDSLSNAPAPVHSISFIDANRGWIVLASADTLRILITSDGGQTWNQAFGKAYPYSYSAEWYHQFHTARTMFLSGDTGWVQVVYHHYYRYGTSSNSITPSYGTGVLLKTYDGGQSWIETVNETPWTAGHRAGNNTWFLQGLPTTKYIGSSSSSPLGCGHSCTSRYAPASENRLKRMIDGDTTGSQSNIEASATQYLRAVHFLGEDTGIAVGTEGLVLRTHNGGILWEKESITGIGSLTDVKIVDRNRAFAVDGRLLITDPTQPFTVVGLESSPARKQIAGVQGNVLRYTLPYATHVSLTLLDAQGRIVWNHDRTQAPGNHSLTLPFEPLPTGKYFLDFRAGAIREALSIPVP